MKEYIFSDYVFLREFKKQLVCAEDKIHVREKMIQILEKRISSADRANGVWPMPTQRKNLIDCCKSLRDMLSVNLSMKAVFGWLAWALAENEKNPPKCKVLFLAQEFSVWPSLESVYLAMRDDERFEPDIVYVPFHHPNKEADISEIKHYEHSGLKVYKHTEYDVSACCPDIVFYVKPYDENIVQGYRSSEIEKIVDRLIYIPYGMEFSRNLFLYGYRASLHYKAWKHVAYGDAVKGFACEEGYNAGRNIAVWGHPKADIYRIQYEAPEAWKEKIRNKRVLLWCPHHTIMPGPEKTSTWLEFSQTILKSVRQNPEIVLLLRPHPLLFPALVHNGLMSQEELDTFIRDELSGDQIILDDSGDYRVAISVSEGLITDGTTFAIEYLYSGKPYMITTQSVENFYWPQEMAKALYIGTTPEEVEQFIRMFSMQNDPKREVRTAFAGKTFFRPEHMTVGAYISEQVIHETINEEQRTFEGISCGKIKNASPRFSILVFCYKNSDVLRGMIDSICDQDYPNIELIVSDDGSPDSDCEDIERWIRERNARGRRNITKLIVCKNKEKQKSVTHIASVLSLATGEYVVFTVADDRFADHRVISSYVHCFQNNPQKQWLVGRMAITTPNYASIIHEMPNEEDVISLIADDPQVLFERWCCRELAVSCCMAFRARAFELAGGIDRSYTYLVACPLVLQLLLKGYAPIFLDKRVVLHSAEGVTNSNNRYGIENRRAFYEDKYRLLDTITKENLHLLSKTGKKHYQIYRKEIIDRNYFIDIDLQSNSKKQLVLQMLRHPVKLAWMLEEPFMRIASKIKRKKILVLSQLLLMICVFLFTCAEKRITICWLFSLFAWLDLIGAMGCIVLSVSSALMQYYYTKKIKTRKAWSLMCEEGMGL